MPLPPPPVPVFAGDPTPAIMDTWIQDSLGFQTTSILFRAERHASQALTASAYNIIAFDTILEDPYSGWNGTSHQWVAPYTGWYAGWFTSTITAAVMAIAPTIATTAGQLRGAEQVCSATFPGMASASFIVPLVGGTGWIQGQTYTSATGTTNTVNGRYTTIEIAFVSQ